MNFKFKYYCPYCNAEYVKPKWFVKHVEKCKKENPNVKINRNTRIYYNIAKLLSKGMKK